MSDMVPYGMGGSPFGQLFRMLDDSFRSMMAPLGGMSLGQTREEKDAYLLEIPLPGVAREQIRLTAQGSELAVLVTHQAGGARQGAGYQAAQQQYSSFTRSFPLDNVRREGITAALSQGVLRIRLPKADPNASPWTEIPIS